MNEILRAAILSLDAYNRGSGAKLQDLGDHVAGAELIGTSQAGTAAGTYGTSFAASTYLLAGGRHVIAFRGTDDLADVSTGWLTGAGEPTRQAADAIRYYQAAVQAEAANPSSADPAIFELTGHSLGGGLAGLVSSFYGRPAAVFNNMPFEAAAVTFQGNAAAAGTDDETFYSETFRSLVYGTGPVTALSPAVVTYTNYYDPLGAIRLLQSAPQISFATGQLTLPMDALLGHSMSFQVAIIYAEQEGYTDWIDASSDLWAAFEDKGLAARIEGLENYRASGTLLEVMQHAIAYSAVDPAYGEQDKPFGDTALAAMFDDIGDMKAATAGASRIGGADSAAFDRGSQSVADVVVFHAASLAVSKVTSGDHPAAADGVLSTGTDDDVLAVNFGEDKWAAVSGGVPEDLRRQLIDESLDADGSVLGSDHRAADLRHVLAEYEEMNPDPSGASGDAFGRIATVSFQTSAGRIGSPPATSEGAIDLLLLAETSVGANTTAVTTGSVRAIVAANTGKLIIGNDEDDLFVGGSGADRLVGGGGSNVLMGGDGSDELSSSGWNDRLYGGEGSDLLTAGGSGAIMAGGAGNDVLDVRGGSFTVIRFGIGDGRDVVRSNPDSSFRIDMVGLSRADVTYVFKDDATFGTAMPGNGRPLDIPGSAWIGGSLTIVVRATGDSITIDNVTASARYDKGKYYGTDWYFDGTRDDLFDVRVSTGLVRYPGDGGGGFFPPPPGGPDFPVLGRVAMESLGFGGDAGEAPPVSFGDNAAYVTAAADHAAGVAAATGATVGTSASDVLAGGLGDDVLDGGAGDDRFATFGGSDRIDGEQGHDVLELLGASRDFDLQASGAAIVLADVLGYEGRIAATSIEEIRFGADGVVSAVTIGTDSGEVLVAGADHAILVGGGGNDTITATASDVRLFGGDGDDSVSGGTGSDTLDGGGGDDTLSGGAGSDFYVWRPGGGSDVVVDGGSADDFDELAVRGIDPLRADLSRDGDDLLIDVAGSVETLRVIGQFASSHGGIDLLTFGPAASWTRATILARVDPVEVRGTAGADVLSSPSDGAIFIGSTGNDVIERTTGEDTYLWNVGDGDDVIRGSGGWDPGAQIVRLGASIGAASVTVTHAGSSNPFGFGGGGILLTMATGGSIEIEDVSEWSRGEVAVRFADGTLWDKTILLDLADATPTRVEGSAGADTLTGTDRRDVISGGTGDDELSGRGGSDVYVYASGDGNDTIDDFAGFGESNLLRLGDLRRDQVAFARVDDSTSYYAQSTDLEITDLVTGQVIRVSDQFSRYEEDAASAISTIEFSDGSTLDAAGIVAAVKDVKGTSGDDSFVFGFSGWTLSADGGDDYVLVRGDGGGTMVFGAGDGHDILRSAVLGRRWIRDDTLQLRGLDPDDVTLTRHGESLLVTIDATGDVFEAEHQWNGYGERAGLERIVFADGTSWNRTELQTHVFVPDIIGTSADDLIEGTVSGEVIRAGLGDDTILTSNGSDVIVWELGDGDDVLRDWAANEAKTDTVRFGAGIAPADVVVAYSGPGYYDVRLTVSQGGSVTLEGIIGGGSGRDGRVTFADGTVWTSADLVSMADANPGVIRVEGTTEGETVYGTGHADLLVGLAGDDYLAGFEGSDTYEYRSGDGNDVVQDDRTNREDVNTFAFRDLALSQVSFRTGAGYDLVMVDTTTGQSIVVKDQFYDGYGEMLFGVDAMTFADGATVGRGDLTALIQASTTGGA